MLDSFEVSVLFIFGTILGSFLNALAFRYQSGKSMWGRSQCMTCNKTLEAIDLLPILSYLFLGGKCRSCKARISIQYPLVEVCAGIFTVLAYQATESLEVFLLVLAFFQILLFIAVYDIRHTIIPDTFVYAAACIALVYTWASAGFPADVAALNPHTLLAGPVLALPIWAVWYISRGRAMGLGDAKVFLAAGWFLGLSAGIAAFVLSFWIGAIVGVFLLLLSRGGTRGYKMNSEIPFGPFIVASTAFVYFAHLDFYQFITFFG